jgi:hypothetical protein
MASDVDALHTYEQIAIRLQILTHPVDSEFTVTTVIEELIDRHYHVHPAAVHAVFVQFHTEGLVHMSMSDRTRQTCCVTAAGRMALARERRALRKVVLTFANDAVHQEH